MAGPTLFVRVPGSPFRLNDLRYDSTLLQIARAAFDDNKLVSVHDLGTLETFEMLYSTRARELALAWASHVPSSMLRQAAAGGLPGRQTSPPQPLLRAHGAAYERIGDELVARVEPKAVVFRISAPKDLVPSTIVASRVRAIRPRSRVFACGSALQEHGLLAKALKSFDAVSWNDEFPIREVLDSREPSFWQSIPNLAYYDGARLTLTGANRRHSVEPASLAISDKFLYISPGVCSKIHVFDVFAVASGEGLDGVDHCGSVRGHDSRPPVSTLRSITERFGSRAFILSGIEHSSDGAIERHLLASGLNATFACTLDPSKTVKTRVGLLSAAGCVAADVEIPSGSQRLLDTYHDRRFTITEAERLLRASKFAGIFTAVHVTYPCAEDDYHTEDETLRLLRRTNPSSVVVTPESAARGTSLLAQEFGPFRRLARARAFKQAAQLKEKIRELSIPLDIDGGTALLAGLAGYRARETEFAEQAGLQLLSGDTTGLAETIERINAGAARPARTGAFRPFTAQGNAVAN